jgi:hypothetical protein
LLLIKIPLVLGFSALGETGIWTSLATGELASAAVAAILLHRLRARIQPAQPQTQPG